MGEAIQSVLDQTYPHFEIIVVDDASPDRTADVVREFSDPCLRYIRHERNRGAVAARYTGVRASTGDIIAFLDQDDLFHPMKLETHVSFLEKHPEIDVSYNSRFEMRGSSKTIFGLWRPPQTLCLADLVLGFPISPSDTVLRRRWALCDEIWNDSFAFRSEEVIFNGHEIVFGGRLALAGCQFANVGRALNYRRFHTSRELSKIKVRCEAELACQETVFSDPRCPEEILALRDTAFAGLNLVWAYQAFFQDEVPLGQSLLRNAVELKPPLLEGNPCEVVKSLMVTSCSGHREGFETLLQSVFANLPPELAQLSEQYEWAISRGYLLQACQSLMWGDVENARASFARASELGADLDECFAQMLTARLVDYEAEFGAERCRDVMQTLLSGLERVVSRNRLGKFTACYWINQAFHAERVGDHNIVATNVLRALSNDLSYLTNRGALAILLRSFRRRF